jgi:acetyl-CoA C-acetyltransferase
MMSRGSVVLSAPVRTAIGTFGGSLKEVPAPDLGAAAIRAAVQRAGLKPDEVGTVAMGHVVQAGAKMNPARQAAIGGGVPVDSAPRLRSLGWVYALILLLLCAEWVVRRRVGMR